MTLSISGKIAFTCDSIKSMGKSENRKWRGACSLQQIREWYKHTYLLQKTKQNSKVLSSGMFDTTGKKKDVPSPIMFLFLSKQMNFSRESRCFFTAETCSEDRGCPGNQRCQVENMDLKQFLSKFRLDHLKEDLKWAVCQDVLTVAHSAKGLLATDLHYQLFPKQLLAVPGMEARAWSILNDLRLRHWATR